MEVEKPTVKKKKNQKMMVALVAAVTITAAVPASFVAGAASLQPSVRFQIGSLSAADNNGTIKLANAPYIEQGVSMVPARAFAEGLDATIAWEPLDRSVRIARGDYTVRLKDGEDAASDAAGQTVKLPASVTIKHGQAFIPARSVAELLGADTAWDNATRKIEISVKEEAVSQTFDFDQGIDGWEGGFADLPFNYDPDIYHLVFARALIDLQGNKHNYGLKLSGMNRSDDLFMFAARKLDGLKPNTAYEASLSFALYTDQAGGMIGVGGAPGEAVSIKAGFSATRPEVIRDNDGHGEDSYLLFNLDKGNQSVEGKDLKIVGDMVKSDDAIEGFQPKTLEHKATLKSNGQGELFVVIGSDSGYEGLTTLYLDDIQIELIPQA